VVEDTIPPTTTLVIGEPKYFKEEEEIWYVTSETPFTLISEDNEGGSGVNYTMYRIWQDGNWSDWILYEESFTLEEEGYHYLEYYSIDLAGNMEEIHNLTYFADNTAPITYLIKDDTNLASCPYKFALICCSTTKDTAGNKCDYWIHSALYAYFTLIKHGYKPQNIVFILWYKNYSRIDINNWINNNLNALAGWIPPGGKQKTHGVSNIFCQNNINGQEIRDMWNTIEGSGTHEDVGLDKFYEKGKEMLEGGFGVLSILTQLLSLRGHQDKIEVTLYLVDHGTYEGTTYYYKFDDEKPQNPRDFDVSSTELAQWVNSISCKRMLIFLDFCYSGGFMEDLSRNIPAGQERVIVTAADKNHPAKYENFGSHFFIPFWNELNAGKDLNKAYKSATKKCENINKLEGKQQNPQISVSNNNLRNYNPFREENVNGKQSLLPSVRDEGCGVLCTTFRLDNEDWMEFSGPISIMEEGLHALEIYSVDNLGNKEEISLYDIYVDNTPPSSPKLISPINGASISTTPIFNWSYVNDVSQSYYILQVSTEESFNNIVFEKKDIVYSEYIMNKSEALDTGTTYYWRIKAVDGVNNSGEWSEVWSFTVTKENNAPDKPSKPVGPTTGKFNVSYTYSSSTTDADGDKIQYCFDWGDGTFTWTDWYDSGETANASHVWYEKGTYQIKVKAIDIHGYESEWSDPLPVIMPYSFDVSIEKPEQDYLYIFGKKIIPLRKSEQMSMEKQIRLNFMLMGN